MDHDYKLSGCYLILWYAQSVKGRRVNPRPLPPLYGATRYICDALNLSRGPVPTQDYGKKWHENGISCNFFSVSKRGGLYETL